MRILCTGASGFLGSAIVRELFMQEHEPIALIRPSVQFPHRLLEFKETVRMVSIGDYGSFVSLEDLKLDLDGVIACGWWGTAREHYNSPAQVANIQHLCDLFHATNRSQGRPFFFVGLGSQAEYDLSYSPIDESGLTIPRDYYGAAKLAAYTFLKPMATFEGARFCWARLFSAYGPDEDPAHMLPTLIEDLIEGRVPDLTACEQRWDYVHVSDAAKAIVALAVSDNATGVFNLGSGHAPPLRDTVNMVRELLLTPDGHMPRVNFGAVPYRYDQPPHLEADISKLVRVTGWSPQVPLSEGLAGMVEWHQSLRIDDK